MSVRRRRKVWKTRRCESERNKRHLPSICEATAENLWTLCSGGVLWLITSALGRLPGLVDQKTVPRAGEILHVPSSPAVDVFPDRFADGQEVWPQTADGVFGHVRQRLADGGSERKAAHGLVDARQILGPRLVRDARHVDSQAFAADDLHDRRANR